MKFVEFVIVKPSDPGKKKRVATFTDDVEGTVRQFEASGWRVIDHAEKNEDEVPPDQLLLARRNTEIVQSGLTTGSSSSELPNRVSIPSASATTLGAVFETSAPGPSVAQREVTTRTSTHPSSDLEAAVRHAAEAKRQGVDVTVTYTRSETGPSEMKVTVNNTATRQASFWLLVAAIAAGMIVLVAIITRF